MNWPLLWLEARIDLRIVLFAWTFSYQAHCIYAYAKHIASEGPAQKHLLNDGVANLRIE
jgi:hypothetical protein